MLPTRRFALVLAGFAAAALLVACAPSGLASQQERVITLYVAPDLADCVGEMPRKCMRVRERLDAPYTLFYDQIEGFTFEPGHIYRLRVAVRDLPNPPADASSLAYRLLEVVEKTPARD